MNRLVSEGDPAGPYRPNPEQELASAKEEARVMGWDIIATTSGYLAIPAGTTIVSGHTVNAVVIQLLSITAFDRMDNLQPPVEPIAPAMGEGFPTADRYQEIGIQRTTEGYP